MQGRITTHFEQHVDLFTTLWCKQKFPAISRFENRVSKMVFLKVDVIPLIHIKTRKRISISGEEVLVLKMQPWDRSDRGIDWYKNPSESAHG